MRALSEAELLDFWEAWRSGGSLERNLALLEAATGRNAEELGALSVGQCNAFLLALRALTFGPRFISVTVCGFCKGSVELNFDTAQFSPFNPDDSETPLEATVEGYKVRFRLPTGNDLLEVRGFSDVVAAREALLERCILESHYAGTPCGAENLPEGVTNLIELGMEQRDANAILELLVTCPECAKEWKAAFDPGAYFWMELESWGMRMLEQVHQLARAYGWTEREILALPKFRREIYLEMTGA